MPLEAGEQRSRPTYIYHVGPLPPPRVGTKEIRGRAAPNSWKEEIMRPINFSLILTGLLVVGVRNVAQAQHDGDVWVGRTSTGQLKNGGNDLTQLIPLQPTFELINGWANNNPGFDRVITAQPANNLYPMASGAEISLRLVAADSAFRVIDNSFEIVQFPGEETFLGDHLLHTHLTWHINSDDPAFDPLECEWQATFVLVDHGTTGYRDSAPFTLMFTLVFQGSANGDFTGDGLSDLEDFVFFENCMTGPRETTDLTCQSVCLGIFDFNGDGDLDLVDFAAFQTDIFGG